MNRVPSISGYTLGRVLGENGVATVYFATQDDTKRDVALKVLYVDPVNEKSIGERFLREARIIARLVHPNVVPVYDVGKAGQFYFMAMEYLPGGDLTAHIKKGLSAGQIMRVARSIASALDAAHKQSYIHRDVRPDNILFRQDGTPVLTDFGIAKDVINNTNNHSISVSAHYLSPEQIKDETVGVASDWYAFGIVLYQMLMGKTPFDGKDAFVIGMKHLQEEVPHLPSNKIIFQHLIDGLLQKDKNTRLQTGKEVLAALDAIYAALKRKSTNPTSNSGTVSKAAEPVAATKVSDSVKKTAPTPSPSTESVLRAQRDDDSVTRDVLPTSKPMSSNRNAYIISAVSVVFLLLALIVFLAPTLAPNSSLMAINQTLRSFIEPAPKVDTKLEKITQLLVQAQTAIAQQHYVSPLAGSALEAYRQVLQLDAVNIDAENGLNTIAELLIKKALNAIETNDFSSANDYLRQARTASVHAAGLLSTESLLKRKQQEVQQAEQERIAEQQRLAEEKAQQQALQKQQLAQAEKERQLQLKIQRDAEAAKQAELAKQKAEADAAAAMFNTIRIRGLVAKAATHFARAEYYTPAGENALTVYAEVLSLDANNQEAIAGLKQTVAKVVEDLQQLLNERRVSEAQSIYSYALQYSNNDAALYAFAEKAGW